MRILVACEESGVVRDAFAARGHDAWSNDLVSARHGGKHLQMDCLGAMRDHGPWDIIIFHPDCTKMAVSGNKHYGRGKPRHGERLEALAWTATMWGAARTYARRGAAIENPQSVLWKYLGITPQWIQPFWFGHEETKKTGLGLWRLPPLLFTLNVEMPMWRRPARERHRIHHMAPGPNRKRDRSETFAGIAEAFAEQWGAEQ